ncbi:Translation initiation factor IF-2, mitochondrial [Daldinia childiae]|uniref:Translation initiation factor IF-2, mitochondrial n=1 Tax=Daldinia childiae TaxID=326645 RepID=UPI001445C96B|nr:Translation initiation factor IF-2, mitochondrial [Daldinia childiae]KAF3066423.1 Translation initiation factor IF-2, mitochondrial [Daldinia childiae]
MLRARVSGRESSICAFCRHRLSLRSATPRIEKYFSNTTILRGDDGWGSGWGGQVKSQTESKPDDFLSPHELLARQQLLTKQQTQQATEAAKPNPANNGPRARYIWNAQKQEAIEESLHRDGMTINKPPVLTRDTRPSENRARPGVIPRRPLSSGFNSTTPIIPLPANFPKTSGPNSSRSLESNYSRREGDRGSNSRPLGNIITKIKYDSQPNTTFKWGPLPGEKFLSISRDNVPEPSQATSQESGIPSKEQNQQPPTEPTSQAAPDNTIKPSPKPGNNSGWGLLARKQTPSKSDGEDFWAVMNKSSGGFLGPKSQDPTAPEQASKSSDDKNDLDSTQPPKKDPWAAMKSNPVIQEKLSDMDDWGKEFDNARPKRRAKAEEPSVEEDEGKKSQAIPEFSISFQGQDRNRGRDNRLDGFDGFDEERRGGGRDRRSRRSYRRGNDGDDEGGFDYDQYQEKRRQKAQRRADREAEIAGSVPILLPELISIPALAQALKVEPNLFLTQLGELGFEGVTLDSLMAGETAALVAQEYGYEPTVDSGAEHDLKPRPPPADPSVLPLRPPVVTIMGHVDHGKTTLLDYLRKSSIAAQEHGGITQRIGAFSVKLSSGMPITFLDTPGHAAFLTMRQRGAYVTDIVVLVVAADDSVKPQTIEAIKHARAAKVPMIVAISKIDTDGARIDQVKHDLAREGVEIEDFGGDVQVVCVSGKTGQGMEDLEENILLLSEILDHRAEIDGPAEGWVLESSLKPLGKAATVLVKRGTLRPGDYIAAGITWAKIRHLRNEAGLEIDEAPPGTPVEILGWKDLPAAGDQVLQSPDEGRAKIAVEYREGLLEREKDAVAQAGISEARKALQEKRAREKAAAADEAVVEPLPEEDNGPKIINFVVKGDLHGSVEAVCAAIQELGNHEVQPRILRSGTGPIREFDVEHAAASSSVIVNFATTTPGYIEQMAEEKGVKIMDHTVIYHLVDDVKATLSKYLEPEITSRVLGEAEVLQVFPINIKGRTYKNIAGCRVRNGQVARNNLFRIIRGGKKIYGGKLETLKHLKKDVAEVRRGTECGIGFDEFQDFQVGDQIQAYEEVRTERSL